jgi:NADH:ubiquinone oxidoreductase subunit E
MVQITRNFDELIATNREEFRALGTSALELFPPDDREQAASMTTKYASVDAIIDAWHEQIAPMYTELDKKHSDARLKKTLIRQFGFHDNDAQHMIDVMIEARKDSLLQEVLDNLYHSDIEEPPYQREHAAEFLSQPASVIEDFAQRYIRFAESVEAAEQYNVTLCDPHSSWIERQRAVIAINKERQHTATGETARLKEIDAELTDLVEKDSLLASILEHKLSLVHLLDLATKYTRSLERHENKDDPAERLKTFETVVMSYRSDEVQRIARSHHAHSLHTLSTIQAAISDVLLKACELTPTKRNTLLIHHQRYVKLTQEKELLVLIQQNRARFFETE